MTNVFDNLIAVLTDLSAEGRQVQVFFRDDDVTSDEPELHRLLALFVERYLPVTPGVIPALLTEQCSQQLRQIHSSTAGRIEPVQHGWAHLNHELTGRKCEFGLSRTYAEQLADIARGQERMQAAFGEQAFSAFIPPWNRCTDETLRALDALRFRVLSRDSRVPVTGYNFRDISTTIDIFDWSGGALLKPTQEIIRQLCVQCRERDTIGVLLHHQVMQNDAFAFLTILLDVLQAAPAVEFCRLRDLAEVTA